MIKHYKLHDEDEDNKRMIENFKGSSSSHSGGSSSSHSGDSSGGSSSSPSGDSSGGSSSSPSGDSSSSSSSSPSSGPSNTTVIVAGVTGGIVGARVGKDDFWKTPTGIFVIVILVLLPFIVLAFRYAWNHPYIPKGTAVPAPVSAHVPAHGSA
jgi:hypothetical protein